ncbi:hypothetical protein ACRBEV_04805 [Methylobacterium phyllosphaerae]
MIAALFALAAAMIIGGCAAVIQGFPYVRLESGLAMVIAGSVAASSGAILLGLGVVALGFRRVERAIGQAPLRGAREEASADAPAASAGEDRPRLPPVLPAAPAFIVPSVIEPAFDPERPRIEPSLQLRADETRASLSEPSAVAEAPVPAEPEPPVVPPVVPELRLRPEPEAPKAEGVIAPEDDLFAAPEPPSVHREAPSDHLEPPPSLRPGLDAAPEPEPEPAPPPATRTVVGRYASGGNTYVMFEDGAIEAETPQGRFTFASLDELKAFVDGGGETGARGAA